MYVQHDGHTGTLVLKGREGQDCGGAGGWVQFDLHDVPEVEAIEDEDGEINSPKRRHLGQRRGTTTLI